VDVGGHHRELDAGILQELLDPVLLRGADPDQVGPVAGQVPQPADLVGWHEAGSQHLSFGDLAQPDRVQHVGLRAPRQVTNVLGVDQPRVQPVRLEQVERRPHVVAGGFHHHPLDPQLDQPVGQVAQRADHGRVRGHLLDPAFPTARRWEPDTAHDLGLPDVQRGDPLDDLLIVF
jgi:hypothetical protein